MNPPHPLVIVATLVALAALIQYADRMHRLYGTRAAAIFTLAFAALCAGAILSLNSFL